MIGTSLSSGAFRLGWQQADRFTGRMALLIAALDTAPHRKAAESVLGFVSDDVWEDTRAWVVSLGADAYQDVVDRSDRLTETLNARGCDDDIGEAGALLSLQGTD